MDLSKLLEGLANLEIHLYFKELALNKPITLTINGLESIYEGYKDGKNKTYTIRGNLMHDSPEHQLTTGQRIIYSTYRKTFEIGLYKALKEATRGDQALVQRYYDEDILITINRSSERITHITLTLLDNNEEDN
jgi:hypothetical protein